MSGDTDEGNSPTAGRFRGSFASARIPLPTRCRVAWPRLMSDLVLENLAVKPAALQQLTMLPVFDDPAFLEHENQIRVLHGRETLGDDERRAALAESAHGFLDQVFRL